MTSSPSKDHAALEGNQGDFFEMILIQVKGGGAAWPTSKDVDRLRRSQRRYDAKAVILAVWKRGEVLELYRLVPEDGAPVADFRRVWTLLEDPIGLFR